MYEARLGISLDDFVSSLDPLRQFQQLKKLASPTFLLSEAEKSKLTQRAAQAKIAAMQLQ